LEHLEEIHKFLDTYDLQKLNQEDIKNVNTLVTGTEIGSVIKCLQQKSPGLNGFTVKFYQTFKEELIPMLLKLEVLVFLEGHRSKIIL
jgi:hypothetical protein